jgi:hypothetical protein
MTFLGGVAAVAVASLVAVARGQEEQAPPGAESRAAVATAGAKAAPPAPVDREQVAALTAALGSAEWTDREAAQKALAELGPDVLTALDERLPDITDPEILRRLERVYRRWVSQERYAGDDLRPGFLGIQLSDVVKDDPRMGERENGIRVMGVVPDTAAERGGLNDGDLIVSLNGTRFLGDYNTDHFRNRIQRIGAGGAVRMGLWRDQAYLELDLVLGAPPASAGVTVVRVVDENGVEVRRIGGEPADGQVDVDERVLGHRWATWWRNHLDELRRPASGGDRPAGEPSGGEAGAPRAAGTTKAAEGAEQSASARGNESKEKP